MLRFLLWSFAFAFLVTACGPSLHVLPVANPMVAVTDPVEIRIPHPDGETQHWCEYSRATDCLDNFWHLETMMPQLVVIRYRRVGSDREEIRANPRIIDDLELWTSDGTHVRGRLHDRFNVEALSPIYYEQMVCVESNRIRYAPQADGSVVARPECDYGTERQSSPRFSGSNYVVFEGANLITPQTRWVEMRQARGGLFGREHRFRWTFDGGAPVNVEIARSPELDRPDLARTGPVHRK